MPKYQIHHFNSLTSTQDKAKELAKRGLSNIVIVADKQTSGRGRFKRKWHSDKGGLWMSILLKPDNIQNLQYLTFSAAIAVADSIEKIAKLKTKIKWPNDVHFEGKKLCGILTEGIFGKDNYVIIGIGLNINQKDFPDEIKNIARSLRIITKKNFYKELFLEYIAKRFFILYRKYFNKGKIDDILKIWKRHCDTIGRNIIVISKKGKLHGKAVGIDNDCSLLLRVKDGRIRKILEGDIKVRYTHSQKFLGKTFVRSYLPHQEIT